MEKENKKGFWRRLNGKFNTFWNKHKEIRNMLWFLGAAAEKVITKMGSAPGFALVGAIVGISAALMSASSLTELLGGLAGPACAIAVGLLTGGITATLLVQGCSWGVGLIKAIQATERGRAAIRTAKKTWRRTKEWFKYHFHKKTPEEIARHKRRKELFQKMRTIFRQKRWEQKKLKATKPCFLKRFFCRFKSPLQEVLAEKSKEGEGELPPPVVEKKAPPKSNGSAPNLHADQHDL